MRIGLLETGRPPADLAPRYGDYRGMFRRLLAGPLPEAAFSDWAAIDGELPDGPDAADGWLVTGSPAGAYEDAAWIADLADFLRETVDAGRPVFGICFGHQILARALGGEVVKAEAGWGVGVHRYSLRATADWMDDGAAPGEDIATLVSHQDQVTAPPPGARLLAASDFCPHAMLEYAPHAVGLQSHPEMSPAFCAELYDGRRDRIGEDRVAEALAGLDAPLDADRVAGWMAAFFRARTG